MRATLAARLLATLAAALLLRAVLAGRVASAVAGLGLLLFLAGARWHARASLRQVELEATRVLPDAHHRAASSASVRVHLEGLAPGFHVAARDHPPADVAVAGDPVVQGTPPLTLAYRVGYRERGVHAWDDVEVTLTDRLGLNVHRLALPCPATVHVHASEAALRRAKRLARRNRFEATARDLLGLLFKDLDIEGVREFAPGDRLRDVDWKRTAYLQRLVTRTYEQHREAHLVLLLDASRTMRQRRGETSKLDHAQEIALQLLEAAWEHGAPAGLVLHDEGRVVGEVPPTRGGDPRVRGLLERTPRAFAVSRRLDVGDPDAPGLTPADEGFLGNVRALQGEGGPPRPGVRSALERLERRNPQGGLVVVHLTDLESAPAATGRALAHLASRGNRALLGLLPGSRFLEAPPRPTVHDLETAVEEARARGRMSRYLRARGVQVVELGPEDTGVAVTDAVDAPRARRGGVRG